MKRLHLLKALPIVVALACSPSVNPALKASVDQRVLSFPASSEAVYEAPGAAEPMPLAVGQWSRYKLINDKGEPSLMTYKVVGQDGSAYWLETVSETYYQKQTSLMLVDLGDRRSPESVDVRAMKQKLNDDAPTELPGAVLGLMKSVWRPLLEGMIVDWQNKPQRDAMVAAGSFKQCYEVEATVTLLGMSESSRSWSHPAVPLGGGVKSESMTSNFSMELLEFGTEGATSEIGI